MNGITACVVWLAVSALQASWRVKIADLELSASSNEAKARESSVRIPDTFQVPLTHVTSLPFAHYQSY
jgi:hypothetical protein